MGRTGACPSYPTHRPCGRESRVCSGHAPGHRRCRADTRSPVNPGGNEPTVAARGTEAAFLSWVLRPTVLPVGRPGSPEAASTFEQLERLLAQRGQPPVFLSVGIDGPRGMLRRVVAAGNLRPNRKRGAGGGWSLDGCASGLPQFSAGRQVQMRLIKVGGTIWPITITMRPVGWLAQMWNKPRVIIRII